MITIGQLARYVGVSTKTIRVYHAKQLLPEPERDASGYRRYTAQDIVELIKIRTLAEAGVPLARIRSLKEAPDDAYRGALSQIDEDLTARIRHLKHTQRRLRELASGRARLLSTEVDQHLQQLAGFGFSARWVAMERDLWILVFATQPETAQELFRDQAEQLTNPALRKLYLDYDRAYDLEPSDPFLVGLAGQIVEATAQRYGSATLPEQGTDSEIPQLIQGAVNASSPAWQRLDSLIRDELRRASEPAARPAGL